MVEPNLLPAMDYIATMNRKTLLLALGLCLSLLGHSQHYSKDVQSVDAIINALYDVISGEGGAPRNWERFRYLFAKDARLVPTYKNADSLFSYRILTVEEYITRFSSRKEGFFEWEIGRKTESYAAICQVFSTYATRYTKNGDVAMRGINSIQLLKDQHRYYILHIFWSAENLGFPIPADYINGR
jgi:hypothetical protein